MSRQLDSRLTALERQVLDDRHSEQADYYFKSTPEDSLAALEVLVDCNAAQPAQRQLVELARSGPEGRDYALEIIDAALQES